VIEVIIFVLCVTA